MNTVKKLTDQFKKTRLSEGLSSDTVTGNTGNGVYHMESGKTMPRIDTFVNWCNKLGLEIKLVKK